MHALNNPLDVSNNLKKRKSLKPQQNQKLIDKVVNKLETEEADFEIVDLDLTMFRGIGTNHQKNFERNIMGRNSMHL
jgi:hypothetical protein